MVGNLSNNAPLDKWLSHRSFTAKSGVQFPYGVPRFRKSLQIKDLKSYPHLTFLFGMLQRFRIFVYQKTTHKGHGNEIQNLEHRKRRKV